MSRPTFVRAGAAVIAVAAATSLAACGGGGGGGGGSQSASDTLTIGLNADAAPGGYDPLLYSQGQFQFFSAMYDALFVTEPDGEVEPSLVTEFENNADNTQTTLTLQDGVTFTDGSTLDSTLVKANLDRRSDTDLELVNGTLGAGGAQRDHRRRRARPADRRHHLGQAAGDAGRTPSPTPPASSSAPTASRTPTRWRRPRTAPAPYTLNEGETTRASTYTLDKNDEAWNADEWSYDTIVFKVITDRQALANAVVSGQADVGRCARPDHGRAGRVQAERRQVRWHDRRLPGHSTRPVPTNPAFAEQGRRGSRSATPSTARRS